MLIINADDWGRSQAETDAALSCFSAGRIHSVTAMVFMQDSRRAADLAIRAGLDVGLHLNLNVPFTGTVGSPRLASYHAALVRFMGMGKYSQLIYNPFLRNAFKFVYQAQSDEFGNLYGRLPSHIDGHQHRHLCLNMLLDGIIPPGHVVRRNFTFDPGEKGMLNRRYRRWVDRQLARRYRLTDYFYSLERLMENDTLDRVCQLGRNSVVELMAHPVKPQEFACLMSEQQGMRLSDVPCGSFMSLSQKPSFPLVNCNQRVANGGGL
jgi:predicted glycoside hydrolase/deacetylase ChbG (UPF0249 family)